MAKAKDERRRDTDRHRDSGHNGNRIFKDEDEALSSRQLSESRRRDRDKNGRSSNERSWRVHGANSGYKEDERPCRPDGPRDRIPSRRSTKDIQSDSSSKKRKRDSDSANEAMGQSRQSRIWQGKEGQDVVNGERDGGLDEHEVQESELLPVTLFKDELMSTIRSNQIIVCTGETGSGKTTQIPQYLLELVQEGKPPDEGDDDNGDARCNRSAGHRGKGAGVDTTPRTRRLQVAVTQPRRVAATSVARRVAEERGCRLGEDVGYSIRFEDCTGPNTRIKYMTDGLLVRECLEDPHLSRYGVVMLDEAHERSIDTDILFGLLKRALARRLDLHVVITSATLDVERFAAFFGNCPCISIPGRTHQVDLYHSKTRQVMTANGPASSRYVEDAVEIILKVHRTQGAGHLLVFLTGQDEIERACRLLQEAMANGHASKAAAGEEDIDGDGCEDGTKERPRELLVVPLYGALSAEAQAWAFQPAREGVRKAVIATNIAETSITVPGIRFVIDPGYVKQKTYDPARRMESLIVVPISKVAAQQRAGRAGRTGPGQCYRLYSRNCYSAMLNETVPEILRTNLASTLLYLKVLGVNDVLHFDFLDPPAEDQALEALQHLYCLGALDRDGRATSVGRRMSRFPLDPSLSRVLLEAESLGCLEESLTIVALLSVESIWYSGSKNVGSGRPEIGDSVNKQAQAKHAAFRHPLGDHFTYLTAYRAWEASGHSDVWAKEAFLRAGALRTARRVRAQLLGEVKRNAKGAGEADRDALQGATKVASCGGDMDKVRKAFCAGYFVNAGQRCSKEWVYRSLAVEAFQSEDLKAGHSGMTLMYFHPSSSLLHARDPPEHVIYTDLVFTARPFMRHAMAVKGRWVRSLLESVQACRVERLSGRARDERANTGKGNSTTPSAATSKRDNHDTSREGGITGGKPMEKKVDAVAAARARYLARKHK